ncbi:hypothetical protein IMSAG192_01210 [Muribaculaceae bacterium]|nr:hypothetical protein IMSAG192_01210 [Muribaculaceae bacterium]
MRPRCCKYFGLFFFNLGFGQFFFLYGCHYGSLWFFLGFSLWCRCRFLFFRLSGGLCFRFFFFGRSLDRLLLRTLFAPWLCHRRWCGLLYCGSLWLHRSFDGFWRGCGLRYLSLLFYRCRFSLFSLRLCGCGFGLRFWLGFWFRLMFGFVSHGLSFRVKIDMSDNSRPHRRSNLNFLRF